MQVRRSAGSLGGLPALRLPADMGARDPKLHPRLTSATVGGCHARRSLPPARRPRHPPLERQRCRLRHRPRSAGRGNGAARARNAAGAVRCRGGGHRCHQDLGAPRDRAGRRRCCSASRPCCSQHFLLFGAALHPTARRATLLGTTVIGTAGMARVACRSAVFGLTRRQAGWTRSTGLPL